MGASVEICDGDESWPLAEALDRFCYPPEVMATIVWRGVKWAHADKRVFVRKDGDVVCHVGLYWRRGLDSERPVQLGGVGGVMTLPIARKRGFASAAMERAVAEMKARGCDFGLLFCEPHNIAFYERLGWQVFEGQIYCEQHDDRTLFDIMNAMVLPLRSSPQNSLIDLCGLPW